MATKRKLRGPPAKQLSTVIRCLSRTRRSMRYDRYLAAGRPISSGAAEGACRHLAKDRMELTGVHWCVKGAQATLELRATHLDGDWEAFQGHCAEEEQHKLSPYLPLVHQ